MAVPRLKLDSLLNKAIQNHYIDEKNMTNDAVHVAVRVRPLIDRELGLDKNEIPSVFVKALEHDTDEKDAPTPRTLCIRNTHAYKFDYGFDQETSQQHLYDTAVAPLVSRAIEGYNGTIFAYGQTGAGKSYTMGMEIHDKAHIQAEYHRGVVPRALEHLFAELAKFQDERRYCVTVSFMEIYNKEVRDLLSRKKSRHDKDRLDEWDSGYGPKTHRSSHTSHGIREDEYGNVIVQNMTEVPVHSSEEAMGRLRYGLKCRTTGATNLNSHASRSHAIFTIRVEHWDAAEEESDGDSCLVTSAKLHLVDLAGSERNKKTGAAGARFEESKNINSGLLALANVIQALYKGSNHNHNLNHVPYRDNILTRLLKDSLGGNSYTLMCACVSPSVDSVDETANTLRYAARARNIRNHAVINRIKRSLSMSVALSSTNDNESADTTVSQSPTSVSGEEERDEQDSIFKSESESHSRFQTVQTMENTRPKSIGNIGLSERYFALLAERDTVRTRLNESDTDISSLISLIQVAAKASMARNAPNASESVRMEAFQSMALLLKKTASVAKSANRRRELQSQKKKRQYTDEGEGVDGVESEIQSARPLGSITSRDTGVGDGVIHLDEDEEAGNADVLVSVRPSTAPEQPNTRLSSDGNRIWHSRRRDKITEKQRKRAIQAENELFHAEERIQLMKKELEEAHTESMTIMTARDQTIDEINELKKKNDELSEYVRSLELKIQESGGTGGDEQGEEDGEEESRSECASEGEGVSSVPSVEFEGVAVDLSGSHSSNTRALMKTLNIDDGEVEGEDGEEEEGSGIVIGELEDDDDVDDDEDEEAMNIARKYASITSDVVANVEDTTDADLQSLIELGVNRPRTPPPVLSRIFGLDSKVDVRKALSISLETPGLGKGKGKDQGNNDIDIDVTASEHATTPHHQHSRPQSQLRSFSPLLSKSDSEFGIDLQLSHFSEDASVSVKENQENQSSVDFTVVEVEWPGVKDSDSQVLLSDDDEESEGEGNRQNQESDVEAETEAEVDTEYVRTSSTNKNTGTACGEHSIVTVHEPEAEPETAASPAPFNFKTPSGHDYGKQVEDSDVVQIGTIAVPRLRYAPVKEKAKATSMAATPAPFSSPIKHTYIHAQHYNSNTKNGNTATLTSPLAPSTPNPFAAPDMRERIERIKEKRRESCEKKRAARRSVKSVRSEGEGECERENVFNTQAPVLSPLTARSMASAHNVTDSWLKRELRQQVKRREEFRKVFDGYYAELDREQHDVYAGVTVNGGSGTGDGKENENAGY